MTSINGKRRRIGDDVVYFFIYLCAALSVVLLAGIITGVILAIGRIVGESAALLFTAGSAGMLPKVASGYFSKIMQSGGTLTIKLYLAATSEGKFDQAFGIAVVLLVIVFLINILTKVLAKKFQAK